MSGSRRNIHRHYDLGNEFFALWLDERLLYTCAYYPTPDLDLEAAQVAKMDHVCRKLELRAGDRVVEAGCGWGGLALHMARRYGVSVDAYNISREQVAFARERARRAGLADLVRFHEADYRSIAGTFDVFVSVGMLEHVGTENYHELGRTIDRCLTPQGRVLIHTIGRNRPQPLNPWIARRIFPGARPPTLGEMAAIFEPWDFSVLDVENLRLHYARTLEQWLERYEAAGERVRTMFDERFLHAWRLYLCGSIAGFRCGSLQLFQVVLSRGSNNRVPLTRAHLYREATAETVS
jgi:cyclopropane-fatty-acyl-phospholipid synthase